MISYGLAQSDHIKRLPMQLNTFNFYNSGFLNLQFYFYFNLSPSCLLYRSVFVCVLLCLSLCLFRSSIDYSLFLFPQACLWVCILSIIIGRTSTPTSTAASSSTCVVTSEIKLGFGILRGHFFRAIFIFGIITQFLFRSLSNERERESGGDGLSLSLSLSTTTDAEVNDHLGRNQPLPPFNVSFSGSR